MKYFTCKNRKTPCHGCKETCTLRKDAKKYRGWKHVEGNLIVVIGGGKFNVEKRK